MAMNLPMMNQGNGMQALQNLPSQYPPQYQMGEQQYGIPKRIGRGIKHFFAGRSEKMQQVPNVTPEQFGALQQILQMGLGNLQNPYEGFGDIENYATQQFQGNIVPSLAERFTSMGGSDTAGSSDFTGSLGAAGAGLASELGALKQQYGFQNRGQALEQLNMGLRSPFETLHRPAQAGALQELLQQLMPGLGSAAKGFGQAAGSFYGNKYFPM